MTILIAIPHSDLVVSAFKQIQGIVFFSSACSDTEKCIILLQLLKVRWRERVNHHTIRFFGAQNMSTLVPKEPEDYNSLPDGRSFHLDSPKKAPQKSTA